MLLISIMKWFLVCLWIQKKYDLMDLNRMFIGYIVVEYKDIVFIVKCCLFFKGWIVIKYFMDNSNNM